MQTTLKLGTLLILTVLVAFIGCDSAQQVITGTAMQPADPGVEAAVPEMEGPPAKVVLFVNYPLGGKEAYLAWVATVVPVISAPEELQRVASYDNYYGEAPHRLVEFEFANLADAMHYMNRPEIAEILAALPDHTSESNVYFFIQRSDYTKALETSRTIKTVYLINYPLGGKAAYLDWIATLAPKSSEPEQLKRVASYDNYYGESPHRFVESEFDSIEDANTYQELEVVKAINAELPNRASSVSTLLFELRGDYVNLGASQ